MPFPLSSIAHVLLHLVLVFGLPPHHAVRDWRINTPAPPSHHGNHLILPNLPSTPPSNHTPLFLPSHQASTPQCWSNIHPSLRPRLQPIFDPADCYDAILVVVGDDNPDRPIRWTGSESWRFESCSIHLQRRADSPVAYDTFTTGEITRHALLLQIECVTEREGYLGGRMGIGRGVFDVLMLNPVGVAGHGKGVGAGAENMTERIQKRVLPMRQPNKPLSQILALPTATANTSAPAFPSTNLLAMPSPTCYPPSAHHPAITHPTDCVHALSKILESAPFYPETWYEPVAWIQGSCAIWLLPLGASEGIEEDTFGRAEVAERATKVWMNCVFQEEGRWRGGRMVVGEKAVWEVSIEGLRDGAMGLEKVGREA